ncbi:MAG: hypothetical protein K1X79_08690 [Oligoflexia bacterium]|nr:hypothetical protein [Oligoflexia bacterium]
MPITFNSNISALRLSRAQNANSQALGRNLERLGSGLRINRASDDAAGLAVASGLSQQARVLNRGLQNVNDGISALQIVDATYGAVGSILQRMGELATQAASGVFSGKQRIAANTEYQQLDAEIKRLSAETKFNGIQLTEGSAPARAATSISSASPSSIYGVSGDGRFVTYYTSSTISQLDTVTGQTTTLVSGLTGSVSGRASGSGNLVAFVTNANLTGQNSSSKYQVYTYDKTTGVTKQVTSNTSNGGYTLEAVSLDGSTVAYSGNNIETFMATMYVYRPETGTNTRFAASGAVPNTKAFSISNDGNYVAFVTDLFNGGTGNQGDVFRYNVTTGALDTLTSFGGTAGVGADLFYVAVANTGRTFFISQDDVTGGNPDLGNDLFSVSTANTITQITNISGDSSLTSLTVSVDGTSLMFLSEAAIGTNTFGNTQLFKVNLANNSISQVTNYTDGTAGTAEAAGVLAADGNSVVYNSSGLKQIDFSPTNYTLNIEAGVGASGSLSSTLSVVNGTLRGLNGTMITTRTAASGAITTVNRNIEMLTLARGTLGANLSRLSSAQSVLSTRWQEVAAASSRITDIDMAEETAQTVRRSILQDTTSALFAQAKRVPEIALQLLTGSI